MAGNKAVAYMGPGKVEVRTIDYPTFELKDGPGVNPANVGRKTPHGVDPEDRRHQHLRQRPAHGARPHHRARRVWCSATRSPARSSRPGRDVEFIKVGDLCSVPFNIACGRCRNCKEGKTGICLNVNPDRPGSAYGYVDMGGWVGGQAEYVMVPYADWNLLQFPDKDQAMEKILDLAMLSDIFPTGYHGCVTAGVSTGSTVYVAGAGPVGLAAATSAFLLGAAVVIVGDLNEERLAQARSFGCETVDVSKGDPTDQIEQILGEPEVDCGVDAVGFEARGHGGDAAREAPATVLNSLMDIAARRRRARHPRPVRDRRPGRRRRRRQGRLAVDPARPRLGQVARVQHRPVPGDEVQPPADDGDPARPGARSRRTSTRRRSRSTRRRRATRSSTRARPASTSSTRTA